MTAAPFLAGLCTVIATLTGGAFALKFESRIGALLGFSSGAVIGVALLDLLPEAMKLGTPHFSTLTVMSAVAGGLLSYLFVDEILSVGSAWLSRRRAHLGPASLTAHSFMDGLGIGLAFHVSYLDGIVVALAVLAHDLVDGANTVTLSLAGGTGAPVARRWLVADALAPLAGILLARMITVSTPVLALLLAFFAGCFLYIGASELLPRSREGARSLTRTATTGLGLTFIYIVVRLAER